MLEIPKTKIFYSELPLMYIDSNQLANSWKAGVYVCYDSTFNYLCFDSTSGISTWSLKITSVAKDKAFVQADTTVERKRDSIKSSKDIIHNAVAFGGKHAYLCARICF